MFGRERIEYKTREQVLVMRRAGLVVARALDEVELQASPLGIGGPDLGDYGLALILGALCGLLGIALMRGVTLAEAAIRRAVRMKERAEVAEIGSKLFDEIAARVPARNTMDLAICATSHPMAAAASAAVRVPSG